MDIIFEVNSRSLEALLFQVGDYGSRKNSNQKKNAITNQSISTALDCLPGYEGGIAGPLLSHILPPSSPVIPVEAVAVSAPICTRTYKEMVTSTMIIPVHCNALTMGSFRMK